MSVLSAMNMGFGLKCSKLLMLRVEDSVVHTERVRGKRHSAMLGSTTATTVIRAREHYVRTGLHQQTNNSLID